MDQAKTVIASAAWQSRRGNGDPSREQVRQNGHNVVAVSQRLGHARVSITSDIHAHALPAWQCDVA